MNNGGNDCCGTCPFNGVNKGELAPAAKNAKFFCEIRDFVIQNPYATYCNNHPIRNPVWMRTPRGPIWASVHVSFDSKPLSEDIRLPAELVPPQGEGHYFRIPYFRLVRPLQGEAGICSMCGEASEESIILMLDQEKKFFCSAAHYFEWWMKTDPTAITYQVRTPLDQEAIRYRLKALPEKLSDGLTVLADGERDWVLDVLREIDVLLMEIRNGKNELMYKAVYADDQEFDHPQFYDKLSPYLLQIQSGLTVAGDLLLRRDLDYLAINESVSQIGRAVGAYLRRDWCN
jgi:hypothetical protein